MKNEILSYCKCLNKYIYRFTLDSFFPTKFGRAGRDGQPSVCILLRKKKERTPAELKSFLNTSSTTCLKRGLSKIFSLSDPDGKSSKNLPRMIRSALTNLNSSSCSCVRHRRCVGSMQRGLRCSWKLPVFQVLVINIFYSHCCFEKPFSQVLLHLHDDLYELSIWHLWEGIGMRGGHQDHSWSPK